MLVTEILNIEPLLSRLTKSQTVDYEPSCFLTIQVIQKRSHHRPAWCFITHVIDCSCTMCRILVSVNWCAFFHRINEQCLKWCYVLLIKTWPLLYTLSVMHIHTLNDLHISPHNVFSLEISCIYYTPNLGNNMSNCVYTVKDSQFKQRNYQKH